MTGLKVVPIPTPNLNDLAGALERIAGNIRSGEIDARNVVVIIHEHGRYADTRGFGPQCSDVRWTMGLMHEAIARLSVGDALAED